MLRSTNYLSQFSLGTKLLDQKGFGSLDLWSVRDLFRWSCEAFREYNRTSVLPVFQHLEIVATPGRVGAVVLLCYLWCVKIRLWAISLNTVKG